MSGFGGKQRARAMWASGDFPQVSRETVNSLGPELVDACGIGPGMRVLDVAAGAGNAAIPAAERGADVVACDLAPELFPAGRAEAAARGVSLEWVEADAEALPFADGEFDVVMSLMGAMFAPDHARVAGELVRVCRPGGTLLGHRDEPRPPGGLRRLPLRVRARGGADRVLVRTRQRDLTRH